MSERTDLLTMTADELEDIRRWCGGGCYGHTSQAPKLLDELDALRDGPFRASFEEKRQLWQVTGPGFWRGCDTEEDAEDAAHLLNAGWRAGRR